MKLVCTGFSFSCPRGFVSLYDSCRESPYCTLSLADRQAPLRLCSRQAAKAVTATPHVRSVWVARWWGHKAVCKLCFNWAGMCKQHQQMYQSSGQGCHTIMSHAEHSPQRKKSLAPEKLYRVAWRVRVIAGRALRATPFCVPPRGTGALSWGLYFRCSFWEFVLSLTPCFPSHLSSWSCKLNLKTSRTSQIQ